MRSVANFSMGLRSFTQQGFTMVELLVVLAIAGILLTLVGPFTVNQLDNIKRAQEREEIRLILNEWQFQAFQQRRAFAIFFAGREITLQPLHALKYSSRQENDTTEHEPLTHYTFEHSEFPQQRLQINAHGFITPTQLQLRQGEREFFLNFENLGGLATGALANEYITQGAQARGYPL